MLRRQSFLKMQQHSGIVVVVLLMRLALDFSIPSVFGGGQDGGMLIISATRCVARILRRGCPERPVFLIRLPYRPYPSYPFVTRLLVEVVRKARAGSKGSDPRADGGGKGEPV